MIRQASGARDIEHARDLMREYAGTLGVDLSFQHFDDELASLPGAYAPPAGALLLAVEGSTALGCIALRPLEPPDVAELKRLYVRPAARGRGLGEALSKAMLEFARTAGYRRVRLDTLPTMQAAQALYERLGFAPIAPYTHNPVPETRFLELVLERRRPRR